MSRRTERIASLIRDLVADAIRNDLSDPRIEPMTSITRVEISPDLSIARIYVSVMAREARKQLTLVGLRSACGRMRSLIAPELTLRQAPRIEFHLDESLQRSMETLELIDRLNLAASPAVPDADNDDPSPQQEDN